jgi:hypothetical protein
VRVSGVGTLEVVYKAAGSVAALQEAWT